MNKHIRRVAIAVGVLMVALFLNLNFVQVVKGDDYRNNSANRRVILTEYASPRGQIVVDGKAVAESVATSDELKYVRKYPSEAREFDRRMKGELPARFEERVRELIANANDKAETIATRKASQNTIEGLAPTLTEIVGG